MRLLKRILIERRAIMAPLAVALLVNAGVYTLVVRPLEAKSANAAARAEAAVRSRGAAERDLAGARALVAGKARADQELATFFGKVLPADWTSARNMTYSRVPDLAEQTNLHMLSRRSDIDPDIDKKDRLGRLKTRVVLQGGYEGIRQFVYELETASDFVIIDEVSLAQSDANKPLTLTLDLSTYYRLAPYGS